MDMPLPKDVVLSKHYIAAISVLTVFSVSIVWLRMYSRMFVSRNLWWDDWTMFAASVPLRSIPGLIVERHSLVVACDNCDECLPDERLPLWPGKTYLLPGPFSAIEYIQVALGC